MLRPIVADEERRAGAHLVRPGRAVQARDQVGLRALNDALRGAFDAPGGAGFERGGTPSDTPPSTAPEARAVRTVGAALADARRGADAARCASSSRRSGCIPARIAACRC